MKKVTINGVGYPFRLTLGAMLAYKRETGEDFSKFNGEDMEKMLCILFNGIKSACRAEEIASPYQSAEEIADYVDMEQIGKLFASQGVADGDDAKKK